MYFQAHSLFNSCGARQPGNTHWHRKAFTLQQKYWNGSQTFCYEEQKEFTERLLSELTEIRTNYRERLSDVNLIDGKSRYAFCENVKFLSQNCTSDMLSVSHKVMQKSVDILKERPPCSFTAVAIGSMARGESTPYSDLEYLFLIESKTSEIERYFQRLAMTSYFLIGNLGETKLSYMAIDELTERNWFDDKSKNGFKIDGLAQGAGNIPTGNGSANKENHFILTPAELLDKYRNILLHPDPKEALRGDLTAMVKYMKPIFTYGVTGTSLLENLRSEIEEIAPNKARIDINQNMLQRDMKNFDFKPNPELQRQGFTVNVKKQLFRFPSIILLDLAIAFRIHGESVWNILTQLLNKKLVSQEFHDSMEFQLACACYIRLSAYLHHDSHDDRISVAQKFIQLDQLPPSESDDFACHKRWYVQEDLFYNLCYEIIPMKHHMCHKLESLTDLERWQKCDGAHSSSEWFNTFHTFYCCGRYKEALEMLNEQFADISYHDPNHVYCKENDAFGTNILELLETILSLLMECSEYGAALKYIDYLGSNTTYTHEHQLKLAICYRELSKFSCALAVLEGLENQSGSSLMEQGLVKMQLSDFNSSEEALLRALVMLCYDLRAETQYDYFGDVIDMKMEHSSSDPQYDQLSPNRVLEMIPEDASADIIQCIMSLGTLYAVIGKYNLSKDYDEKLQRLMPNLFGKDTLSPSFAKMFRHIAGQQRSLRDYHNLAVTKEYLQKSLCMLDQIYGAGKDHIDKALALRHLGLYHHDDGAHEMSLKYEGECLAMLKRIYGDTNHLSIALSLNNIAASQIQLHDFESAENMLKASHTIYQTILPKGGSYRDVARVQKNLGAINRHTRKHASARSHYESSLEIYKSVYGNESLHTDIADVLDGLGDLYKDMGQHSKSSEYYKKAISIYFNLFDPHTDHVNIAYALSKGSSEDIVPLENRIQTSQQSLQMYQNIFGVHSSHQVIISGLNNIGIHFFNMGHYQKAADYFGQSLNHGKRNSHVVRHMVCALNNLGQTYYRMKDYTKGVTYMKLCLAVEFDDLLQAWKAENWDDQFGNKVDVDQLYEAIKDQSCGRKLTNYHKLQLALVFSEIACFLSEARERGAADKYYQYALDLVEGTAIECSDMYYKTHAKILGELGERARIHSNYKKAAQYYLHARKLYDNIGEENLCDRIEGARITGKLAVVYASLQNLEESDDFLKQCVVRFSYIVEQDEKTGFDFVSLLTKLGKRFSQIWQFHRAQTCLDQALAIMESKSKRIKGIDTISGNIMAELHLAIANNFHQSRRYKAAEEHFLESLKILGLLNKEHSRESAHLLKELAAHHLDRGNYHQASMNCERSLSLFKDTFNVTGNQEGINDTLLMLGGIKVMQKEFVAARQYFTELIRMHEDVSMIQAGSKCAELYHSIGKYYGKAGEYHEAQIWLTMALDKFKQCALSEDKIDQENVVSVLNNRGTYHLFQGDLVSCRSMCDEAFEMCSKIGEDNCLFSLQRIHGLYGKLYKAEGNYSLSLTHHMKSLQMIQDEHRPNENHFSIAQELQAIARVYKSMGPVEKVEEYLMKALSIYETIYSSEGSHEDIGDIMKSLGFHFQECCLHEKSLSYMAGALSVYKSVYAERYDFKVVDTIEMVALGCYQLERLHDAVDYFNEARLILKQLPSNEKHHKAVAKNLYWLGMMYNKLNQYEKADAYFTESYSLYCNLVDDNDIYESDIADVLYMKSYNLLETPGGYHMAALQAARSSIILYHRLAKKDSKKYINVTRVLHTIAAIHDHCKDRQSLESCYVELVIAYQMIPSFQQERVSFANVLHLRSINLCAMGQLKSSIENAQASLTVYQELPDDDSSKQTYVIRVLNSIATTQLLSLDFGGAEKSLKLLLHAYDGLPDQIEKAQAYTYLGAVYEENLLYEDAIQNCRRSMEMIESLQGYEEDHELAATNLEIIGLSLIGMGKYDDVENTLQNSLGIFQRLHSAEDKTQAIASTLHSLARYYYTVDQHTQAIEYCDRSFSLLDHLVCEHEAALKAYIQAEKGAVKGTLAKCRQRVGEHQHAVGLFKESLETLGDLHENLHDRVATTKKCMADSYVELGEVEAAKLELGECLQIYQKMEHRRDKIVEIENRLKYLTVSQF